MSTTEYTTITVREETKERLDKHRDGKKWDAYLEQLRREHADPLTLNDVDEIAERLDGGGVDTDALAREIVRQFDYVELSNQIADELQGRFS